MPTELPITSGRLAVTEIAQPGERVLWLHGYTMTSAIWLKLWNRLGGFHHFAVDLPGHGASPQAGEITLPQLARSIATLAAEHDIGHLIGISFGATVALQVAVELPEAFATVILAAPAAGGFPDPRIRARMRDLQMLYHERGPGPWMTSLWMQSPPEMFRGVLNRPQLWGELCSIIDGHQWCELSGNQIPNLTQHVQSAGDLHAIESACLLVLGEEEMRSFTRYAYYLQSQIPRCRRLYLPQTGHLSLLEDEDAAARVIREHLERNPVNRLH